MASADEFRAQYCDIVRTTSGLIFKTLVIVPLLLLAVAHPLLDYEERRARLERERRVNNERATRLLTELASRYRELRFVAADTIFADIAEEVPEPPASLEDLDLTRDVTSEPELNLRKRSRNRRHETSGVKRPTKDAQKTFETEERAISAAAGALSNYLRDYKRLASIQRGSERLAQSTENLRVDKGKIPTPFGNFELDPRLGLLALGFAGILTYLAFHIYLRRLVALGWSWHDAEERAPISGWPPPWWSYPLARPLSRACAPAKPGAWVGFMASLLLHVGWLAVILVLYWAANKWNAQEAVLLPGSAYYVNAALASGGMMSLVLFIVWITDVDGLPTDSDTSAPPKPSRRTIIRLALGAIAAVSVAGAYSLFRLPARRGKGSIVLGPRIPAAQVVVNVRSGVAHHIVACKQHLPRHSRPASSGDVGRAVVHVRSAVKMLEEDAAAAMARLDWEKAEHHLLNAISLSPFSVHLYDYLVRQYGRLKTYEKIQPLLARGLQQVLREQDRVGPRPPASRSTRRFKRAVAQFEDRLKQVERRARASGTNSRIAN
jgi:hypothetical protein